MKLDIYPWARARLNEAELRLLRSGEPYDATLRVGRNRNGSFHATLQFADRTSRTAIDPDCKRAITRVLGTYSERLMESIA